MTDLPFRPAGDISPAPRASTFSRWASLFVFLCLPFGGVFADIGISLTANGDGRFYDYFSDAYAQVDLTPDGMYSISTSSPFGSVDAFPNEGDWNGVGELTLGGTITGTGEEIFSITGAVFDFQTYVDGSKVSVSGTAYTTILGNVTGTVTLFDGVVQSLDMSADIAFAFNSSPGTPFNGTLTLTEASFILLVDDTIEPIPGAPVRHVWDFSGGVQATPDVIPPAPIVPVQVTPSIVDGNFVLNFPTHNGNFYQVKWTDDPGSGPVDTWNDLGALITGDGTPMEVTDESSGDQDARFYAVVISN